ncbi:MAG TPA: superoxide dismutase, partial [Vicinamibacteria bacterium]
MPPYKLPDLSYDYGALEPHISGRIMQLHHDKHHSAYVKGANETLEKLAEARHKNDFAWIGGLEKALAFHVSGHVLHSLFWKNMKPRAGDRPTGELAKA